MPELPDELDEPLELPVPLHDPVPPVFPLEPLIPPHDPDPLLLPIAPPIPPLFPDPPPIPPPGLADASEGASVIEAATNRQVAANEIVLPNPDMRISCCKAAAWEPARRDSDGQRDQ